MPIVAPIIAALMALMTLKEGGDIAAKLSGEDSLLQLLGLEPSKKTAKKLAKEVEKASASATFREIAATEGKSELEALLSARRNLEAETGMGQLESVLEAKKAGLDIADIIPAGMRPGRILQKLQENEIEAWKKIRDAAPERQTPMSEAVRQPPPSSPMQQMAAEAGPGGGA